MDGLAVYQEIRRLRPETVALLATAFPNHPRAEASVGAGVPRIVPKPVDLSQLLSLEKHWASRSSWWSTTTRTGAKPVGHTPRAGLPGGNRPRRGGAAAYLPNDGLQVALIDMRLPDADGEAVFRTVRQANPQARTVLITGYRAELAPAVAKLVAEGADAVCYKPFDMDELLTTLGRLSRP